MTEASAAVSFESDIKPLFRERDRQAMSSSFDLGSYEDVQRFATQIISRLRSGSMPCDGAWPQPDVDLFQRWIDAGKLP